MKNNNKKYINYHIIGDFDLILSKFLSSENKLIYETHIKIKNEFSQNFFKQAGFVWPTIDKKYIQDLLTNI